MTAGPAKPLFVLDLKGNGGHFAPKSTSDLQEWLDAELNQWQWVWSLPATDLREAVAQALQPLRNAAANAKKAVQMAQQGEGPSAEDRTRNAEGLLRETYQQGKIPHSTSPLFKRVAALRNAEPISALAFMFALVSTPNQRFDSQNSAAWHGFIQGLIERYGPITGEAQLTGHSEAIEELRGRLESLLGDNKTAFEELHRQCGALVESTREALERSQADSTALSESAKTAHETLASTHGEEMAKIRLAFTEQMKLRGPVGYWEKRKSEHESQTKRFGKLAFGTLASLAAALALLAWWAASTSADPAKPDAWKLAVAAIVAVLGVWAVRLLVRIYLSHRHLATDSAERVVMIQTYLALMADDKITEVERPLILQPLFKPAADGIVKDEGLPHPVLELFTRPPK